MTGTVKPPSIEDALDALPLFPLPRAVLFPGSTMALHVFEPRYRALVRDVLATHGTFSVVQIVEAPAGAKIDPSRPPIARYAGVGTIADHVELSGGRYDLLLTGHSVVELDELAFVAPYRRARARIASDSGIEPTSTDLAALVSTASSFARVLAGKGRAPALKLPKEASPGRLADLCAAQLVLDGGDRQRVLEQRDVGRRVRLVTEILALQRVALGGRDENLN
jgi:ATP-dependent Lon protease